MRNWLSQMNDRLHKPLKAVKAERHLSNADLIPVTQGEPLVVLKSLAALAANEDSVGAGLAFNQSYIVNVVFIPLVTQRAYLQYAMASTHSAVLDHDISCGTPDEVPALLQLEAGGSIRSKQISWFRPLFGYLLGWLETGLITRP